MLSRMLTRLCHPFDMRRVIGITVVVLVLLLVSVSQEQIVYSRDNAYHNYSYGATQLQAPDLWEIGEKSGRTLDRIGICIVDSGVNFYHPELQGSDFRTTRTNYGPGHPDYIGHGTKMANFVGAQGKNLLGISGVIPNPDHYYFHVTKTAPDFEFPIEIELPMTANAQRMAIRGCLSSGKGNKVIIMSFGSPDEIFNLEDFQVAYEQGALMFAASGNVPGNHKIYPAYNPYVISVGAVDREGRIWDSSTYNTQVELMGPGVGILDISRIHSGVHFVNGTSVATAYVGGVSSDLWRHFPECKNYQIRMALIMTAKDVGVEGCDEKSGYGVVQAKAAYDLLDKYGCSLGMGNHSQLSLDAIGGCGQWAPKNDNDTCKQSEK